MTSQINELPNEKKNIALNTPTISSIVLANMVHIYYSLWTRNELLLKTWM